MSLELAGTQRPRVDSQECVCVLYGYPDGTQMGPFALVSRSDVENEMNLDECESSRLSRIDGRCTMVTRLGEADSSERPDLAIFEFCF